MRIRVTLDDIARRTGVSKATVSLALRHHPRIPETTRRRICKAADHLGYRPDPALARLAAHRWRSRVAPSGSTIAFVTTNHPTGDYVLDTGAIAGARAQAEAFGYSLEHFRFENYGGAAHLGAVIFNRGIRGVLLGQLMRSDFCGEFPWHHFSVVGCNVGFFRPPVHVVMPDHAHALVEAWHQASRRGYRRIGVVLFEEEHAVDEFDKTAAALYCQDKQAPGLARIPVLHTPPDGQAAFAAWLRRERPDAVLGFNDLIEWWLRANGYRVPADIGFASLMRMENDRAVPGIAGMDYDLHLIGRTALELLDIQLRTNQTGIPERRSVQMIESRWVEGNSLQPRKAAASRRVAVKNQSR